MNCSICDGPYEGPNHICQGVTLNTCPSCLEKHSKETLTGIFEAKIALAKARALPKMDPPRSCRLEHLTPAELAIQKAVEAVEYLGADTKLTDAVILLGRAREKVAAFVDEE